MLDPVEERVRLEEPVLLDRDRDVRELALERHGVVLAGLPQSDDVVPGPQHVLVQAGLRLGVGVGHAIVDDRLHVDLPTERDRIVDFAEELAREGGVEAPGRVRQDDLQGPLHDRAVVGVSRGFRGAPRADDESSSIREVVVFERPCQVDQGRLELARFRAELSEVLRVESQARERVLDGLQEGRLPHRLVRVAREGPHF